MLVCPECNSTQLHTADSRNKEGTDYLYRRRRCGVCGAKFTTVEISKDAYDGLVNKQNHLAATEKAITMCRKEIRDAIRLRAKEIESKIGSNN